MMDGRRYTLGVAIADLYVLAVIPGSIVGLYVAISHRPVPLWELFQAAVISMSAVILYYSRVAREVTFLTRSETLLGSYVEYYERR